MVGSAGVEVDDEVACLGGAAWGGRKGSEGAREKGWSPAAERGWRHASGGGGRWKEARRDRRLGRVVREVRQEASTLKRGSEGTTQKREIVDAGVGAA